MPTSRALRSATIQKRDTSQELRDCVLELGLTTSLAIGAPTWSSQTWQRCFLACLWSRSICGRWSGEGEDSTTSHVWPGLATIHRPALALPAAEQLLLRAAAAWLRLAKKNFLVIPRVMSVVVTRFTNTQHNSLR